MTLQPEYSAARMGPPAGGDPGALILALWRLRSRGVTGLQWRERGLTSGPFQGYQVRARARPARQQPTPEPYYPDDLVMDRRPNMWRVPDRDLVRKPGLDMVPATAAALPAAGALAARVLAATGQHLGPAAIAALLALGLHQLADQVARYLGLAPAPGWITFQQDVNAGPGWVDYTQLLLVDLSPGYLGVDLPTAFYDRDGSEGLPVGAWNNRPAIVPPGTPPVVGSALHAVNAGAANDLWPTGPDYPYPADWVGVSRLWVYEGGATPDLVLPFSAVFPMPEAETTRRPAWADRAPARSSPWPQGWKGGYAPPVAFNDQMTAAAAAAQPQWKTEPQPRYKRERKSVVVSPAMRQVLQQTTQGRQVLEWLLEAGDAIGAIFKALPPQIRRIAQQQWYEEQFAQGNMEPGRISADAMAATIVREFRWLDSGGVIRELAWEQFQDQLYGMSAQGAAAALQRLFGNRFQGSQGTVSPNWEHFLDPSLPFAGPYTVRNEYKMKEWVPAAPLHEVMQAVTGRRERDAMYRAQPSPELRIRDLEETARRRRDRQGRRNRARDYAVWRAGRDASGYVQNSMNRRNTGWNSNPKSG